MFITKRAINRNSTINNALCDVTNRLQMVMNAAAGVVSDTGKYNRGLKTILHYELHWLDVHDMIGYCTSLV